MNGPEGYRPEVLENKEYHFEEIAEIEGAMISLVEQLKTNMLNGEYDALVSDDAGGRIPTLILRKIMQKIIPQASPETHFIAAGHGIPHQEYKRDYNDFLDSLKMTAKRGKRILLITQYIHSGNSLKKVIEGYKSIGFDQIDVAAMDRLPGWDNEKKLTDILGEGHLFAGSTDFHKFHEKHNELSGVRKSTIYSPSMMTEKSAIKRFGRKISDEIWREVYDIQEKEPYYKYKDRLLDPKRNEELDRRIHKPLSEQERFEIQRKINLARQDVDLMAKRIFDKVFNVKQNETDENINMAEE